MKGRIGKYKDKIVVWGDPNLTAKDEINIDSLGEGGGQGNIPVEYYKVVVPEGENLEEVRNSIFFTIVGTIEANISSFHILVKGTSTSSSCELFTGLLLESATTLNNQSIHAYSIRAVQTITKVVNRDGTIKEIPSFNNIFDAMESIEELADILPAIKKCLVPITAEEFYNLDDLK